MMKLVLAIVQDQDSQRLANKFIDANVRATKLSTTGGFLKSGNTTFIVGIEDERVDDVLKLIKETCEAREQYLTAPVNLDASIDTYMTRPIEVQVGGATVFVLPVEGFYRY